MKSRLSSTIWTLVILNAVVILVVVGLAFGAGRSANGASMFDIGAMPSGASGGLLFAILLAAGITVILAWRLGGALLNPIRELSEFSERLAAGDSKARAEVSSSDEFGFIAAPREGAGPIGHCRPFRLACETGAFLTYRARPRSVLPGC